MSFGKVCPFFFFFLIFLRVPAIDRNGSGALCLNLGSKCTKTSKKYPKNIKKYLKVAQNAKSPAECPTEIAHISIYGQRGITWDFELAGVLK